MTFSKTVSETVSKTVSKIVSKTVFKTFFKTVSKTYLTIFCRTLQDSSRHFASAPWEHFIIFPNENANLSNLRKCQLSNSYIYRCMKSTYWRKKKSLEFWSWRIFAVIGLHPFSSIWKFMKIGSLQWDKKMYPFRYVHRLVVTYSRDAVYGKRQRGKIKKKVRAFLTESCYPRESCRTVCTGESSFPILFFFVLGTSTTVVWQWARFLAFKIAFKQLNTKAWR